MRTILFAALFAIFSSTASSQIRVNPTGVNVNSQNPTTVFLSFGPIPSGYVPAEAIWCGELIPSPPPAVGLQCRPDTVYGALPARFDHSGTSPNAAFTDIMGIPPSIVRRAYQAAVAGASAGFFYVRRFVSTTGGPDQYVNVTCRMTGGGARVPFALTDVRIRTPKDEPILFVKAGEPFPRITAEIQYNGTGRLKGRWEIVQPGEEPPADRDLLTEATLPVEARGDQKRFTQIARFDHFLLPVGKFNLRLEMPDTGPTLVEGQYILLLRIEAVDDKEGDSNLAALGVGNGIVHSGAVASFPMPSLKFFLSGNPAAAPWESTALTSPVSDAVIPEGTPVVFAWKEHGSTRLYVLEISDLQDNLVLRAFVRAPATVYSAPPWLRERAGAGLLRWSVRVLNGGDAPINKTEPRTFRIR
ncbi:MAG: hypothetical protein ABL984_18430 [Pyrinomonadaceae bacterium]